MVDLLRGDGSKAWAPPATTLIPYGRDSRRHEVAEPRIRQSRTTRRHDVTTRHNAPFTRQLAPDPSVKNNAPQRAATRRHDVTTRHNAPFTRQLAPDPSVKNNAPQRVATRRHDVTTRHNAPLTRRLAPKCGDMLRAGIAAGDTSKGIANPQAAVRSQRNPAVVGCGSA